MKTAFVLTLLVLAAIGASSPGGVALAQTAESPEMVSRFTRGRFVLDRAVEAAGGAAAIRGVRTLRFIAEGDVSNDLQGFNPNRVGRPEVDGSYRIETAFELPNGRFFQRITQQTRGNYGLNVSTIHRDGTLYLLRHYSRDYTATPNAPSPLGPGGAGAFNLRLAPAALLQRALQNFRSVALVADGEIGGRPTHIIEFSFDESTRLRLHVTQGDHRVRRVDALAPESIAADDVTTNLYEGDQMIDGVWFPERVSVNRRGVPVLTLALQDVSLAAPPESLFALPADFALVTDDQLATTNVAGRIHEVSGLGGGLFRIQFVIMEDFIVAFEAGGSLQTAQTAINEIRRIEPNKPIRYAVISHYHNDHAGGVGAYVDLGATIVSSPENEAVLRQYAAARPQFAGLEGRRAEIDMRFQPVGDEGFDIVDAAGRRVQVLSLSGGPHVEHLLTLYDPETRALLTADLYAPLVGFSETSAGFARWLRRRVVPVDTILTAHSTSFPVARVFEAERAARRRR